MNHKFAINPAVATIARFRIANVDILASRIANSGERGTGQQMTSLNLRFRVAYTSNSY